MLEKPMIFLLGVVYVLCTRADALDVHCSNDYKQLDMCTVQENLTIHEPTTLNFIDADDWINVTQFEISSENSVSVLPSGIFTTFPKLNRVSLSGGLETIKKDDFKNTDALTHLELNNNKLQIIPSGVFSETQKLNSINLGYNGLTTIEDFAFNGLNELQFIFLQKNSLTILKRNTFAGAPSLLGLLLKNNKIEVIEEGALNIPSLQQLYLGNNLIRTLADNVFIGAPNVVSIFLERNRLTHIGQSLYHLKNLDTLGLNNNPIVDIDLPALAKMSKLVLLNLKSTGLKFRENVTVTPAAISSNVALFILTANELTSSDVLKQLESLGFVNLIHLDLHRNRLSDLEGIAEIKTMFPKIGTLGFSGNKFSCKWVRDVIGVLKEQQVQARKLPGVSSAHYVEQISCIESK